MTEPARQPPIGLIAGGGQFPLLFAEAARARGRRVVAVAHVNETLPELEQQADVTCWVKLGQLGRIIKYFRQEGVGETVFAGTITKTRIFHDVLPDFKGLTLWNKIDIRLDDAILRAVAQTLEEEGIRVIASTCYLDHLFFPQGLLSRKKPSTAQMEDIRFGWSIARAVGRLDIGQCVVVRDRSVLAVEAIEGTDAAIRRGGKLGGPGAVVVKRPKPTQDKRLDLPAIGLGTLQSMAEVGATCLAFEAGGCIFFDQQQTVDFANSHGITLLGLPTSSV